MSRKKNGKNWSNTIAHRSRRERALARLQKSTFTPKNGRTEKAWQANKDKEIKILTERLK